MGAPIFFDNARYLSLLIRRLYGVLLIALAMTASLACFFAYKWYQASNLDNVYLLAPEQTLMATSTDGSLARSTYEISAFAARFLEKAFAHHEYNWQENLEQVTSWMDQASAKFFLAKMNESIEALYKERNAISTVQLKEIEIETQTQPYEVLPYYTTQLQFAATGEVVYDKAEVEGGIYFQVVPLPRSQQNPFGMQIRNLKFLQTKSNHE